MEIITKGHEAENGVRQIMQLFFSLDENIRVVSVLRPEGNKTVAFCEITRGDEKAEGYAETEFADRLRVTNTIKKSVFHAGKKLSDMPTPWGISTGIRPAKNAGLLLESGLSDGEAVKEIEKEYLVERKKAELCVEVYKREKTLLDSMGKNSASIYVGIPFCPSRCSYCSFISQATNFNNSFVVPYVDALIKEIEYAGSRMKKSGMTIDTLYFGGGTPTAISVEMLKRIIHSLYESFDLSRVREFTVEAGRPDTFSKELMDMLKKSGVGRISINPQTMHDKTLERVGRKHSVDDVKRAFYLAHEAGIESINADLIAGLPGEDKEMTEYSVREVLKLKPHAVTVHTLYMKRAAEMIDLFDRIRFTKGVADMVDAARAVLKEEGFDPYYMYKQRNTLGNLENVGYARKGHESLYNVYIMEEVQPILALGAGGSTKMVKDGKIERVYNPKEASDYTRRIDEVLKRKDEFFEFYIK